MVVNLVDFLGLRFVSYIIGCLVYLLYRCVFVFSIFVKKVIFCGCFGIVLFL